MNTNMEGLDGFQISFCVNVFKTKDFEALISIGKIGTVFKSILSYQLFSNAKTTFVPRTRTQ